MKAWNRKPDAVTMIGVALACAEELDLEFGWWVHWYIERRGFSAVEILNGYFTNFLVELFC